MKIKTPKSVKNLNPLRKIKKNLSKDSLPKSDRARTRNNELASAFAEMFK